ncbi:hypothetical protein C5F52_10920 [Limnohabitans sp. TS-CS-82]|uniref:hypothetical protein n=1 Tax=Limnohabitans sp. TS-CS-82 TaxID=2094193 RepID=UPI000CF1F616|nr:hypothetical protein [Limnohabitans sp. TS-CS-82]PQA83206.1 hypothetical protein C5F52_10920 [Limnohabitans sp. TS-CS-82]
MQITFDIETIPSQKPEAKAAVKDTIKPPATLKKPESIAAWWENESAAAVEDAYRKQSFDALHGEIISIAATGPDGQEWVRCRAQGQSEAELIAAFGEAAQSWADGAAIRTPNGKIYRDAEPWLIGHNTAFDLGFLWRRCALLDVQLPFALPTPAARAGKDYGCTMATWAGFGGKVSLDALCKGMGIETSKGDLDGSKVYDAWLAGEYDRIATYNLKDVKATAAVWERLNRGHG